jgi:tetratricopeptide (TPR) repeat protein
MLELGREAERQEDLKHARHYYEQAAALEGPLKGLAALATARVLEALGENEIAGAYYEQFIETSPDSPLIEVARDKLGK